MAKDAASASQRWQQNSQGAQPAYEAGVQSVTTDPGQQAAAQRAAYLQGVQANVDVWAKNVQTGLGNWQARTVAKSNRYSDGIAKGAEAQATFMAKFLPRAQQIAKALPPRGSDAQNEARMLQQVRETRKLRGTF